MTEFRLVPRYRLLAFATFVIGLGLVIQGLRYGRWSAAAVGLVAAALAVVYLRSPSWRSKIQITDAALVFHKPKGQIALPWSDVKKLLLGQNQVTALVVGPNAETSLLVPGPGAPAGYDLTDKATLVQLLKRQVAPQVQREVATIEGAIADGLPWRDETSN